MLDVEKNIDLAMNHGAVVLLVDLLGPPPQYIIDKERSLCGINEVGSQDFDSRKHELI